VGRPHKLHLVSLNSKRNRKYRKTLNYSHAQGIPWSTLGTSRAEYRKQRLQQYRNYENLDEEQRSEDGGSQMLYRK
jgi:hypothetical protein